VSDDPVSDDRASDDSAGHDQGAGDLGDGQRDAARRLLARARRTAPRRRRTSAQRVADLRWSGAGPDPRDPTPIERTVADLVAERKWRTPLSAASLAPRWPQLVGEDVARHCRPDRLEAGELTIVAESTAWATQLRLMSAALLSTVKAATEPGLVQRIRVRGPSTPNWTHGPLRVRGRGPRDTYG